MSNIKKLFLIIIASFAIALSTNAQGSAEGGSI